MYLSAYSSEADTFKLINMSQFFIPDWVRTHKIELVELRKQEETRKVELQKQEETRKVLKINSTHSVILKEEEIPYKTYISWSIELDLKLFGHETEFSRTIPDIIKMVP